MATDCKHSGSVSAFYCKTTNGPVSEKLDYVFRSVCALVGVENEISPATPDNHSRSTQPSRADR
jgi:hypothetical protein